VDRNSGAWDCKVTPVHCACQEGNTICGISSNDAAANAMEDGFSTLDTDAHRTGANWRDDVAEPKAVSEYITDRPSRT
jgi:hypothetical protein